MATDNQDLVAKQSEVGLAVSNSIRAIGNFSKLNLNNTPLFPEIHNLCRVALQETLTFKNFLEKSVKRPYMLYAKEIELYASNLLVHLNELRAAVGKVYTFRSDLQPDIDACHSSLDNAAAVINEFLNWINTNLSSYMLASAEPSLMDSTTPEDKEIARNDYLRCPRWILKQLFELKTRTDSNPRAMKKDQEIANLKSQLEDLTKINKDTEKSNTQYMTIVKKKDEIIQQKEQQLQLFPAQIADLQEALQQENLARRADAEMYQEQLAQRAAFIAKLESQNQDLLQQYEINREVLKKVTVEKNKLKDLNVKIVKILNSKKQSKSKETELQNTVNEYKAKMEELENKNRILSAQLRMIKFNSDGEVQKIDNLNDKVQIVTEISSPEKVDEISEVSKILDQILDDQAKELENFKNEKNNMDNDSPLELDYQVASNFINDYDRRKCFAQVILSSRDYEFIQMLGKVYPVGQDADNCVRAILQLYQQQNRSMELIQTMIDWEVKTVKNPIQLFRGEEFPPKMIRAYTRMIGIPFAVKTIGALINEIIDQHVSIELDTNPDMQVRPPTPEDAEKLDHYCVRFIRNILDSLPDMPLEFLQITNYLTQQVKKRFSEPGATQAAVAGFIFLRFFCPCVAAPSSFDFPINPGQKEVGRTFLLIGKVLQSLANGVENFKEEYLQCMDPFLGKYKKPMERFIAIVKDWPPEPNGEAKYMIQVEGLIHKKQVQLKNLLETPQFSDISQYKWKQVVRIPLHIRMRELLSNFERNVVGGGALVIGKVKKNNPVVSEGSKTEGKLNRGKFPDKEEHPAIKALLAVLLDPEMNIPGIITKSVIPKIKDNKEQMYEIAASLGNIWEAHNFLDVVTGILYEEYSQSEYYVLRSSFIRSLFIWCSKTYFSSWLVKCWGSLLAEVNEKDLLLDIDENNILSDNAKQLKKIGKELIENVLSSLSSAPDHLLSFMDEVCNVFDPNENVGFKFLFINFFASVLESPTQYISNIQFGKNTLGTLYNLSGIFIGLAMGSSKLFEKAERDDYIHRINEWIAGDQLMEFEEVIFENEWQRKHLALMNLIDLILEHEESVIEELKETYFYAENPSLCYSFQLREILDSLGPYVEEKKVTSPAATSLLKSAQLPTTDSAHLGLSTNQPPLATSSPIRNKSMSTDKKSIIKSVIKKPKKKDNK